MNAETEFQVPATLRPLREIVAEYDQKNAAADQVVTEFKSAVLSAEISGNIGGAYGGSIWGRGSPSISARDIQATLLKSAWRHVYDGLGIASVAPAKDRKQFELALENPAPFTMENISATFGQYIKDPRFHILRGLAECFCDLDPAYKSHSKVRIGVSGLPKRAIISGVAGEYSYNSYGTSKVKDIMRSLARYRGEPELTGGEFSGLIKEARGVGEADWHGGKIRAFRNGNAHVIFDKDALADINRALAEFYGEVLPDVDEDDAPHDLFRSTQVSKDLAYYATPKNVGREILRDFEIGVRCENKSPAHLNVLEPSCGDGQLIDSIIEYARDSNNGRNHPLRITGIEYHAARANEARAKGHNVLTANFLDTAPDPRFDYVIMNPPFSGQHWKKHLNHAIKFLRPRPEGDRFGGGTLITILPASAFYDGHLGEMGLVKPDAHTKDRGWRDSGWTDLPVASFAESGTNVPTGFFVTSARP